MSEESHRICVRYITKINTKLKSYSALSATLSGRYAVCNLALRVAYSTRTVGRNDSHKDKLETLPNFVGLCQSINLEVALLLRQL